MAFNPFHGFRKHQKTLFAGLTIICMITFILTGFSYTGRGDFFDMIQTSLGGARALPGADPGVWQEVRSTRCPGSPRATLAGQ